MKYGFDPLARLAFKQRVGRERTDEIATPLLIHLDAAKRGQGGAEAENCLLWHIVLAQVIGSKSGNKEFFEAGCKASLNLAKAAKRCPKWLNLTTTEYKAIVVTVIDLIRLLPMLQIEMLAFAHFRTNELINDLKKE